MGIKCSLLGHSFSDSKVEEEREEQGSEVLTTIKEVEICERCGTERVVSENKEVTSLESSDEDDTAADSAAADSVADEPAEETVTEPAASSATPDIDAAEDDAELIGEAESDGADGSDDEPDPVTDQSTEPVTTAADETDQSVETDDDGAVILDDDEEPDREPGEWPDDEEPDLQGAGEESSAETVDETVEEPGDADGGETEPVADEWPDEYGHDEPTKTAPEVEWPEEDDSRGEDWDPSGSLTEQIDGAEVEPAGAATVTVPDGEFECPECGFRTPVEESSLRAGDFCPECHRGSLEHHAEDETRKE
ncbi:DUF7093 family protein [Halorientalis salina]|uniref:DUF7093 family protein n=1 Tax=Halorientalis salina TaxID=2932266 RepID=UPI0010AD1810|nr:hypothetical protein [Halorientalis salina]